MRNCRPKRRGFLLPLSLLAASACAPMPDPDVNVRHFGSTRYWNDAQFRVFTFDPSEARSLDERIRLARAEIAQDPDCTWADAPRDVIAEATRAQGPAYGGNLLAAPVRCRA